MLNSARSRCNDGNTKGGTKAPIEESADIGAATNICKRLPLENVACVQSGFRIQGLAKLGVLASSWTRNPEIALYMYTYIYISAGTTRAMHEADGTPFEEIPIYSMHGDATPQSTNRAEQMCPGSLSRVPGANRNIYIYVYIYVHVTPFSIPSNRIAGDRNRVESIPAIRHRVRSLLEIQQIFQAALLNPFECQVIRSSCYDLWC